MPTTSGGVAVIATQVARTDRRALSQAWYSALHLARAPIVIHEPHARRAATVSPGAPTGRPRSSESSRPSPARRSEDGEREDGNARCGVTQPERRRSACETSRRVERAVTLLAARWSGSAAQTIDVAGGRVRLLVRADRGTTRIIALCCAPLRDPVERALAHARFALASAGRPIGAS